MSTQKRHYLSSILNKPLDALDRLFPTERASMRGVAAGMAIVSALFWHQGSKERFPALIVGGLTLITFIASFFDEDGREIWVTCAITASLLFGIAARFYYY